MAHLEFNVCMNDWKWLPQWERIPFPKAFFNLTFACALQESWRNKHETHHTKRIGRLGDKHMETLLKYYFLNSPYLPSCWFISPMVLLRSSNPKCILLLSILMVFYIIPNKTNTMVHTILTTHTYHILDILTSLGLSSFLCTWSDNTHIMPSFHMEPLHHPQLE